MFACPVVEAGLVGHLGREQRLSEAAPDITSGAGAAVRLARCVLVDRRSVSSLQRPSQQAARAATLCGATRALALDIVDGIVGLRGGIRTGGRCIS